MKRGFSGVTRIVLSLIAGLPLFGCGTGYGLAEKERVAVTTGAKAIVLLRIQCTVDQQSYEPFPAGQPLVTLGLGGFETVGKPRYTRYGFLSEESCRAGWTFLVLSPGVYYLAILGPESDLISKLGTLDSQKYLQDAPRWRLEVPENAHLVYGGTIQLEGRIAGTLLFGDKIIRPTDSDTWIVSDEHELAERLAAEYFPETGVMKTILMQRWHPGEPIIIRSPSGVK